LTNKENKAVLERKGNVGPFSNCACIKPQKEGFKEAICEVCDKVFTTDKDVYICPECKEKSKK
jgi:Zn finger protein HypA/HybF involved in hydrogenase expression